MEMLLFSIELAWHQIHEGRHFVLEHPLSACSWQTESLQLLAAADGVSRVPLDMCSFGLQVGPNYYSKKPTAVLTNCEWVRRELEGRRCDGTHPHLRLEGGLPSKAQEYPGAFVRAVVRGVRRRVYPPSLSGAKETEQLLAPELLEPCHALLEELDAPEWDEAAEEAAEEEIPR